MGDSVVALDLLSSCISWEFVTRSRSMRLSCWSAEPGFAVRVSNLISWSSDLNFTGLKDTVEDGIVDGPRRAPRYQIFWLASIWRRLIHRNHLLAVSSPWFQGNFENCTKRSFESWKLLILVKHRRWFHSSRVQCPLVKLSASWFLESIYLIWIFGSLIYSVKQPVKSNSVGSENMSQIRTSAFSWSSWLPLHCPQNCTTSFLHGNTSRLRGTKSTCDNSREFCVCFTVFFSDALLSDGFPLLGLSLCFRFELECNTSIIKSQRSSAGISSIRNPESREIISPSVELCETHVLLLEHPTYGNKCVSSKYAQCSTWRRFWIFKISCKIRILK